MCVRRPSLCVVCVCVPLPSGFIIAALRSRVSSWLAAYLYFIFDATRRAIALHYEGRTKVEFVIIIKLRVRTIKVML